MKRFTVMNMITFGIACFSLGMMVTNYLNKKKEKFDEVDMLTIDDLWPDESEIFGDIDEESLEEWNRINQNIANGVDHNES